MCAERLEIDVAFASTPKSLHEIFASVLGFPGYYGMNWDAFDECIKDSEQSTMPKELVIKNVLLLSEKMPREAKLLRECLNSLKDERPEIKILFIDEE